MRIACLTLALALAAMPAQALFGKSPQASETETTLTYDGRELFVHVPARLPPQGARALVIVMHGGMGNAERIVTSKSEKGLNLDAEADTNGFIVAYINGTPVTKHLSDSMRGWNAGECCGQSADLNIDDVAYVAGVVRYLAETYGIDPARVYGIGHSNGAMMTQRVMCEAGVFAAGISISGGLELEKQTCPAAQGRKLLEIHGGKDENVPVAGGMGKGISRKYPKRSQAYSRAVFERSGAEYQVEIVPEAAHFLDGIESELEKTQHTTLPQIAARFFGLSK